MATKKKASKGYRADRLKTAGTKRAAKAPHLSSPPIDLRARAEEALAKTRRDTAPMPEPEVRKCNVTRYFVDGVTV
jgi:hypothetical protein